MSQSERDLRWMDRAVNEGRQGRPSPNPHVGAVIVREDRLISSGHHPRFGEEHAELMALRSAGAEARGATLYVTLEPCNHHGKTPPCCDVILESGVRRVVIGAMDPNPNVPGRGADRLRAAGVEVVVLPSHRGAQALLAPWAKFITKGLPFVSLKLALSLDGRIATRTGASKWVTGEEARNKVHELRAHHDAVAVGIGTALADDPRLTVRAIQGVNPVRIVFDSKLRLHPGLKLVSTAVEIPTYVMTLEGVSPELAQPLESLGVRIIQCPATVAGRIDISEAFVRLAELGITSLLVEGGAELAGTILTARLADEMHAFLAPILLGPRGRPGAVDWCGPELPVDAPRIRRPQWELCGEDAYVHGAVEYPAH